MPLTRAIELTVSIFLLVMGASYLVRPEHWLHFLTGAIRQPAHLLPIAAAMLTGGTFIGTAYDNWSGTWPIFITTFAWLMALEGALLLLFPGLLKRLEEIPGRYLGWYFRGGGLLLMILGALLLRHLS